MRTTHWLIYSQVTKLLCERGANLNARDSWGYTPLQRAATNDCVDAAKALLAAGGGDAATLEPFAKLGAPVGRLAALLTEE